MLAINKPTGPRKLDEAGTNRTGTDPSPESEASTDLDWDAFRARYFPGRRPRHDFQAVIAYGAHKRDRRESSNGGPPARIARRAAADEEALEQAAEVNAWDDEGGAQRREAG